MIKKIPENTPIRTVQTLIDEAKLLGLRVVHRPDQPESDTEPTESNVISLEAYRIMNAFVSPEAA